MDTSTLCQGCLASERNLRPLGDNRDTFDMIITKYPRYLRKDRKFKAILKADLHFCWECIQLLKNVRNFQERVLVAQEFIEGFLKKKKYKNWDPLSKLTTKMIKKPNLTINADADEKPKPFEDEKAEEIKLEIKEELHMDIEYVEPSNSCEISEKLKDFNKDINPEFSDDDDIIDFDPIDDDGDKCGNDSKDKGGDDSSKDIDPELLEDPDFIPSDNELKEKKTVNIKNRTQVNVWRNVGNRLVKEISISKVQMIEARESMKNSAEYVNSVIKCESCIKGFNDAEEYDVHLKTKHNESSQFRCLICNQTYKTQISCRLHRQRHLKKFQCKLCSDVYYDIVGVKCHLADVHRKGFVCQVCGEIFKYTDWGRYQRHMRNGHKETTSYKCNDCDASFLTKREIRVHCRQHITYFCRPCQREFKSSLVYRRHKYYNHPKGKQNQESFYCVECDKQFLTQKHLNSHLKNTIIHNEEKRNMIFSCSLCPKTFKKKYSLDHHYDFAHVGITKYFCEICQKYFLCTSTLKEHKKSVHNKIPLPKNKLCTICGRGFSDNRILINHIRTHTGERPYECGSCGAKFAQRSAMFYHMKKCTKTRV